MFGVGFSIEKKRLTADTNNVSFVCRGTHINASANKTICNKSDDPTININPTLKYKYAF